jgi:ribosomal protein S8E
MCAVVIESLINSSYYVLATNYFYFINKIVSTKKTRILDVVYNASNNELVRTKTLVKNSIIQIDATPFRTWYESHYGVKIGAKRLKKLGGDVEDVSYLLFN